VIYPARALLLLVLALAACGDDLALPPPGTPATATPRAVVVSGDFAATGVVSIIDVEAATVRPNAVAFAAGADPVIRRFGKELFIVNRFGPTGSSVSILSASTLEVTLQLSTGTNSNPQDVAVIDDVLYLPALDTRGVVVLQRSGERSLIDLGSLDPDGRPDCVSIYAVEKNLVIVCGVLDGFDAVRDAQVVIYDTVTSSVVRSTALASRNPIGFLQPTPSESIFAGDLLIATADYGDATARCVVRINGQTGENQCAIENAALGGIANHYESDPTGGSLLITPTRYEGVDLLGSLRTVDLGSAAVAAQPLITMSRSIPDFAVCPDGSVVAADATRGATGIRIFRDGVERTTSPLSIGLPPVPQNGIVCF
jgi:hypothetical protein